MDRTLSFVSESPLLGLSPRRYVLHRTSQVIHSKVIKQLNQQTRSKLKSVLLEAHTDWLEMRLSSRAGDTRAARYRHLLLTSERHRGRTALVQDAPARELLARTNWEKRFKIATKVMKTEAAKCEVLHSQKQTPPCTRLRREMANPPTATRKTFVEFYLQQ